MASGSEKERGSHASQSVKFVGPSFGPRGRDAKIAYTIVDSPLGRMLLAATAHGVCALSFDDSDAKLIQEVEADYPAAEIRRDDDAVRRWAEIVLQLLAGRHPDEPIPLDVRATPFQLRVWEELCAIPAGATRSYAEIARRTGNPKGPRAVGHAIGSNPVSLLIPCHRAIGSDGSLHGYRWGLERKRKLLEIEHADRQLPLINQR